MTDVLVPPSPPPASHEETARVSRRVRAAEWIAFAALIAAFVGALGPATPVSTTYSWPPNPMPAGMPTTVWHTPLLLAGRVPDQVSARIPCVLPPPLAKASEPVTVLSTVRAPARTPGLVITVDRSVLTVRVADKVLRKQPLPARGASRGECALHLSIAGGEWSLDGIPTGQRVGGNLRRMPIVTGLFSELDVTRPERPTIAVTTRTHRVLATALQSLCWVLAAICALGSLLLVAAHRWPRRRLAISQLVGRLVSALHPVDGFVACVLVLWWVIAPAFFDDGWTIARQRAFDSAGGFSQYYESFGVNLPLGYWLEWVQHWLTTTTDALVVLRLPALACLAATWLLVRLVFAQVRSSETSVRASHWALACAFVAMTMAWGMSLRQEPAVAVLVAGSMACCVRFVQTRSIAPLATLGVLAPLALTAHPTGVIALAPVVAIGPMCFRWARERPAEAVAVLTASGALAIALAFVGSDLQTRAVDAETLSTFSTTVVDWREELSRYVALTGREADDFVGYAPPLRRGAIALMLLALAAFLVRRDRQSRPLLDFSSRTLVVALLLFVVTPSKWPWHFAALIGITALAVASETIRLREETLARSKGLLTRWLIGVAIVTVAILWSWSPRGSWNAFDLQTLDWTPSFESVISLSALAALLPVAVVAIGALRRRAGGIPTWEAVPRMLLWSAPIVAMPLIVYTATVLVVDAVRTPSWTTARGNIEGLAGRGGCGLAETLEVPSLETVRSLELSAPAGTATPVPPWVPPPPKLGLRRYALGPRETGTVMTPWFDLPSHNRYGVFVSGRPMPSDRIEIQWGTVSGREIVGLRNDGVSVRPTLEEDAAMPWRLIIDRELRRAPPRATSARIALTSERSPSGVIAVTAPVSYSTQPLAQLLGDASAQTLALPHVVTFFPCVDLPDVRHGIVERPTTIVTTRAASPLLLSPGTSPFSGLLDVYELQRLTATDSTGSEVDLMVYRVDPTVQGRIAEPTRTETR